VPVFLEKRCEAVAADFLFAFNDERNVTGQYSAGLEISFDGLEVRQILAFIIASTPGKQSASVDAGREGWRVPKLEGLGGLHIIVAIDDEVGAVVAVGDGKTVGSERPPLPDPFLRGRRGRTRRFGNHDGMALSWAEPRLQTNAFAMINDPFGAGVEVLAMLGLS